MIVAVLGANGQLGSDLVRVAREFRDVETLALTRKDLDVCELEEIPEAVSGKRFDALVNCTSYHKTDEVEGRATEAFRINAHAVGVMVHRARGIAVWGGGIKRQRGKFCRDDFAEGGGSR